MAHHPLGSAVAVVATAFTLVVGCAVSAQPTGHVLDETEQDGGSGGAATGDASHGGTTTTSSDCDSGSCARSADAGGYDGDAGPQASIEAGACGEGTCQTARDLGAIQGDQGNDTLSIEGNGSAWIKVRVTESDFSVLGHPMSLTVSLVSPAGENFDLFAYGNPDADTLECTNVMGKSTNPAGQNDQVSLEWGENCVYANDSDDSRTITIEVRGAGGKCSGAGKWTLLVQGNASTCS
jgi:hypothetical protein